MTALATELNRGSLAADLRAATNAIHERLDRRIGAADAFASRERYARLVELQYRFMAVVEPLYGDPELKRRTGSLAGLSRLRAAAKDLTDLGRPVPRVHPRPIPYPEALGWLYVIEGSNLGAAFLLKEAQKLGLDETFGAAHLAGAAEGRGLAWRRFKEALDGIDLSPAEAAGAAAGAIAAFALVDELVGRIFEGE